MTTQRVLSEPSYRTLYEARTSAAPAAGVPVTEDDAGIRAAAEAAAALITSENAEAFSGSSPRVIIGISGSVSSGKTTFSDQILSVLSAMYPDLKADIVSTDNFIYPTAVLTQRNIMSQKGFPVSYDYPVILRFLRDFREGRNNIPYPFYSHELYDITDTPKILTDCNILILEGINVLSDSHAYGSEGVDAHIRDFLDASLFLNASATDLFNWFRKRFMKHLDDARKAPEKSYYAGMLNMTDTEIDSIINHCWYDINYRNYELYIGPSAVHADIVVDKDADHRVTAVRLKI